MKCVSAVFLLALCVLTSGCTHTVTLVVKNSVPPPAPPPLDINVVAKDKNGLQTGSTGLGTINPTQQSSKQSFKVKDGGTYVVNANLSGGVNVYQSGPKTISSDLPNEQVEITKLGAPTVNLEDTSTIQATFSKLGANVGFNPMTVDSALSTLFGGLLWYVDSQDVPAGGTQTVIVVQPSSLEGVVTAANFQYPAGNDTSHDDTINTDASIKASAAVPLWGSLTAGFASSSVYKMHWSMTGFGNVARTDATPFQDKLSQLSAPTQVDICNRLQTANSHLMYVNQMYVVKSAVLEYQQGTTVSASAALSGGAVISGSAAYDFSSAQVQQTEIDDTVVNVAGPTFTETTLSFCKQPVPASPAPAPPAPTAVHQINQLQINMKGFSDAKGNQINIQQPAAKTKMLNVPTPQ